VAAGTLRPGTRSSQWAWGMKSGPWLPLPSGSGVAMIGAASGYNWNMIPIAVQLSAATSALTIRR